MKRKAAKKVVHVRHSKQLDSHTFFLLAFVAVALLAFFGWQTGTLPAFLRP